jgi:O-antigen ligase
MVAVFLNGLVAFQGLSELSAAERLELESFVSHGATLPMNAMFILVVAAWICRSTSWAKRLVLPLMAVPVFVVYLASDRRAAFIGLIGGLILLCIVLWWTRRRAFWIVIPPLVLVGAGYMAAFWSSTSDLGKPVQAAKTVIAPDQVTEKDQNSDLYRQVENANITATIRSNPLVGVGFGRPFLKPHPLPWISPFLLADYVTHNSVLWVWMKAGVGGFVAMLYLLALTLRSGARAVINTANTRSGAVTIMAVAFVLVYMIFAYVDIAWDPQNVVLLALAVALVDTAGGAVTGATSTAAAATTATAREPTLAVGSSSNPSLA